MYFVILMPCQSLPDKCFLQYLEGEVESLVFYVNILAHEYTLKFLQGSGIKGV